jgi:hypothetical protein
MSTSPFDYGNQSRNVSGTIWNILSVLVLIVAGIVALVFLIIFINPQSAINPLPPPTLPPLVQRDTATPTPRSILPPTWTPTITLTPTGTLLPSETPTSSPAPTETLTVTLAITPTETQESVEDPSFELQEGSPEYTSNFAHESEGCQWLGVAGHVFDLSGEPITDPIVRIRVGGTLGGQQVEEETMLGMESGEPYGPGGFEIVLGNSPANSTKTLWIQLFSPTEDLPLSEKIYFDTFISCDKNLVTMDFIQIQ